MGEETKVIYYIDDEETPYLMKIPVPSSKVTLGDFKAQVKKPNHKYFFKSMDEDVGIVKEEITEDSSSLPLVNGRVVSWLVSTTKVSDKPESEAAGNEDDDKSIVSASSTTSRRHRKPGDHHHHHHHRHKHRRKYKYANNASSEVGTASEVTASELDTSCLDSESDAMSQVTMTSTSSASVLQNRRRVFTKTRPQNQMYRSTSCSTITESTMTSVTDGMEVISVTLNMDTVNFLGISIVGHGNETDGPGGIFVGSIMKGGAVAADGRIDAGDMILSVNDVDFANLTNEDAVRALREVVQQPGPITLTVAKNTYEPMPDPPMFEPPSEPVVPMDPTAWIKQTNQLRAQYKGTSPNLTAITSSSSQHSSVPESERDLIRLTITSPMTQVIKALQRPNGGIQLRDHKWLKMTINNSFLGSDLVEWLYVNVEGFFDRRHARKYASLLLKHNFINHTVNKITFSEQCYYVFGTNQQADVLPSELQNLRVGGSSDSADGDTIGPLPYNFPWSHSSHSDEQSFPPPYESKGSPSLYKSTKSSKSSSSPEGHSQYKVLSGSSGRGSEPIFKRAPSSDSGGSAKRQSSSVSSSSGGGASIPSMISAGAQQQASRPVRQPTELSGGIGEQPL
ncbi:segment polarity protein dishevelled homolog DVL-3-like isoform X2 [Dysidea avara]|uniref:segment polarity protein dishevelled homolog DVL-3-like isoform X2 n=1 Tax=Dysidea avara TaxID=196820 RepID=UPI00332C0D90